MKSLDNIYIFSLDKGLRIAKQAGIVDENGDLAEELRPDPNWQYMVNVEELKRLEARRQEINSIPVDKIMFLRNGEVIEISDEDRKDWAFTGLSNTLIYELVIKNKYEND